jgi:hypothetical protein
MQTNVFSKEKKSYNREREKKKQQNRNSLCTHKMANFEVLQTRIDPVLFFLLQNKVKTESLNNAQKDKTENVKSSV